MLGAGICLGMAMVVAVVIAISLGKAAKMGDEVARGIDLRRKK